MNANAEAGSDAATAGKTARNQPAPVREHKQPQWPQPLTAREWDRKFPGILDSAAVLAGASNVILQLARPAVGYGVVESRVTSGSLFRDPLKRARTTFTYLAVAMIGTAEEKLAYRKAVNRSHAQVHSTETSPVQYNAFDPELQLWVAACLYWGLVDGLTKFRGPLSREQAAELYKLAQPLGTTLQVRADMWPADLDAFDAYWQRNLNQLRIDDTIRAYFNALIDLKFLYPALGGPFRRLHRFLTTGFLPAQLRTEMRMEWSPAQQRRFDTFIAVIAAINRYQPRIIRQLPFVLVMWDFRRRLRKGLPLV